MGYIYEVGDVVTLKKGHPCGGGTGRSFVWARISG